MPDLTLGNGAGLATGGNCPGEFVDSRRIELVLHRGDPGGEGLGGIALHDGHGPLSQDSPPIVALVHEVHGGAGHPDTCLQDRPVHV